MLMNTRSLLVLIIIGTSIASAGYIVGKRHGQARNQTADAGRSSYVCPMHTFVIKDRPGVCQICGMDLVRQGSSSIDLHDLRLNEHVYVSPTQQVMADLSVTNVMYKPLFKEIIAAGVIAYDQSRQGKASATAAGRIDVLHADAVGTAVRKDRPVAEILTLQQNGQPGVRIPVYPPLNGTIIAKEAQVGQFVKTGDTLLSIADLSQVWAELDVYEDEFPFLKLGQQVLLNSRSYPGETFSGKITYLYPYLDPKTRTVRARVVLQNRKQLLKLHMFVQAKIQMPLGTDLVVPAEAVVVTGSRALVWVQIKPGVFVPRDVRTGVRYRNDVQILEGLRKNEVVAANGAYLVDSESQLAAGDRLIPAITAPSGTSRKMRDDLDMSDMTMDKPGPASQQKNKSRAR